jgi:hypothetical protein
MIWATILNVGYNTISLNDNFFEIGGNSFLATQFLARITIEHGLKMEDFFNDPTITGTIKHMTNQKRVQPTQSTLD